MAYCQPSGVCLTLFCLLTKAITRGWHWENTYQVQNKSAPWLINSKTQLSPNTSTHHLTTLQTYHLTNLSPHKLITSQTYQLTNSKTHQLTTSSTQHPIANPRTHQLINLQTQKLKLFVLFLQNHSKFHAVLAKI